MLGRDALAALAAAIGFGLIAHQVEAFLDGRFPALAFFSFGAPDVMVSAAPVPSSIIGALTKTVGYALGATIVALALRRFGWRRLIPLALAAAAAFVPDAARTAPEFFFHYSLALFGFALAAVWCWKFARNNYLAYAGAFWAMAIQEHAAPLLSTSIPLVTTQGLAVVLLGVMAAAFVFAPALGRGESAAGAAA